MYNHVIYLPLSSCTYTRSEPGMYLSRHQVNREDIENQAVGLPTLSPACALVSDFFTWAFETIFIHCSQLYTTSSPLATVLRWLGGFGVSFNAKPLNVCSETAILFRKGGTPLQVVWLHRLVWYLQAHLHEKKKKQKRSALIADSAVYSYGV